MTNGPFAFPALFDVRHVPAFDTENGMMLRDYFAASAMAALVSINPFQFPPEEAAKRAYGFADAMLTERAK